MALVTKDAGRGYVKLEVDDGLRGKAGITVYHNGQVVVMQTGESRVLILQPNELREILEAMKQVIS